MKTRDLIAASAAGLCILPSAVANVLPHFLAATTATGSVNSAETTTAVFQAVSVLAMAAMPIGAKNLSGLTPKLACWTLGLILFLLNLWNALDVATHGRESSTAVSRGTITRAAGLNSRILELRKSRTQLPQFKITSAAASSAAEKSASAAESDRDKECAKVGPLCRKRMDEAKDLRDKATEAATQHGFTERADKLDAEITDLEKQMRDLGPIPEHADDTAAKAARLIGLFFNLGKNGDEEVSEWRPIAFAIGIEALALIGPLGMVAALTGGIPAAPKEPKPDRQPLFRRRREEKANDPDNISIKPTPAPEIAGLAQTPATPAKPKKPKDIKKTGLAGLGDVREWHNSRTTARADGLVRVNECYAAYVEWCKSRKIEACSLTKFGTVMKGDLGVGYVEKSKRGYYSGIALTGGLKVVASK